MSSDPFAISAPKHKCAAQIPSPLSAHKHSYAAPGVLSLSQDLHLIVKDRSHFVCVCQELAVPRNLCSFYGKTLNQLVMGTGLQTCLLSCLNGTTMRGNLAAPRAPLWDRATPTFHGSWLDDTTLSWPLPVPTPLTHSRQCSMRTPPNKSLLHTASSQGLFLGNPP